MMGFGHVTEFVGDHVIDRIHWRLYQSQVQEQD